MKKYDFSKLKPIGKDDKILLITHTDMDGANVVVMKQMFDNVDVMNCSNNSMSYLIKKNVCEDNDYDSIVVVDISCTKADAEAINSNPNKKKLVLLDHHDTAKFLNDYDWAIVESDIVEDSFRIKEYEGIEGGHSSGTSLLYDYLDYQGHTERVKNKKLLEEYVSNVAMYDTWDWNDLFDKKKEPKELEDVFEMYGIDMFQRLMSEKIAKGERLVDIEEIALLTKFKEKEQLYVDEVSKKFQEGTLEFKGKEYSFLMVVADNYLGPIFDKMKDIENTYDLYIINYGSGLSIRTSKDDIHVGELVSNFGGGGHPGAGGIKIDKDMQVNQITQNLPGTTFYIDRDEKGYILTPKDVKMVEIEDFSKYKDLSKEDALMSEAEDRKRNKSMFLIKRGIITGTLNDENGYSSFAMAFTSNYKEEIKKEMKNMFPNVEQYFVCSDTSFEIENTKTNETKVVTFTEDSVLQTMSTILNGTTITLEDEKIIER